MVGREDSIMVGVRDSGAWSSDDDGYVGNQSRKKSKGSKFQQKVMTGAGYRDDSDNDSVMDGYDIALVSKESKYAQQFLSNARFRTINKLRDKMKRKMLGSAKFAFSLLETYLG